MQKNMITAAARPSGNLIVISAPSGAGKTTLCKALLAHYPDIKYSVSTTTRSPRKGERDGIDYHFMDSAQFLQKLKNKFWAEWALVHDHYYGTSADFLNKTLASGTDVLLDIDVQGTRQILEHYPAAITIFILPPSLNVLKERLKKRGSDTCETIEKRIRNAKEEIAQKHLYRHVIVNDDLETAVKQLITIVGDYRKGVKSALDF
ncbi:MAG: guanylate kinase [Deltaproteobacteria bacterium]|jgi:guanylate kinase